MERYLLPGRPWARWGLRIIGAALLAVAAFAATQDAKAGTSMELDFAVMAVGLVLCLLTAMKKGSQPPKTYPPSEVVSRENLDLAFPGFDVKVGEFVKRDGKVFRVNSTGLQVPIDVKGWQFQPNTGEFLAPSKKRAGYAMLYTHGFSQRLKEYPAWKRWGRFNVAGTAAFAVIFGIPLSAAAVSLGSEGHTVGAAICFFLAICFYGLFAGWLRFYLKYFKDEYILGPEPLTRRLTNFGDEIKPPPAAPAAEPDDYQIRL